MFKGKMLQTIFKVLPVGNSLLKITHIALHFAMDRSATVNHDDLLLYMVNFNLID